MAQLVIKGCEFRGNKVIGILEMIGGKNTDKHSGNTEKFCYYIDENGKIECETDEEIPFPCIYFTLDEFLEKFPYKVGDKVYYENKVCDVIEMLWNSNLNTISYGVYDGRIKNLAIVEELKPYKKETMKGKKLSSDANFLDCSMVEKIELALGNTHEVVVEDGKTFVVRKKPQYPRTYEACCNYLNPNNRISLDKINKLRELINARNAYWKIAGDWKPDVMYGDLYCIGYDGNIVTWKMQGSHRLLVFPTEEMRNAFYENFKDLIEECKELL